MNEVSLRIRLHGFEIMHGCRRSGRQVASIVSVPRLSEITGEVSQQLPPRVIIPYGIFLNRKERCYVLNGVRMCMML